MPAKKRKPEEIIGKLREVEIMLVRRLRFFRLSPRSRSVCPAQSIFAAIDTIAVHRDG